MCINYTIKVLVISMHFGGVADTKMGQRLSHQHWNSWHQCMVHM